MLTGIVQAEILRALAPSAASLISASALAVCRYCLWGLSAATCAAAPCRYTPLPQLTRYPQPAGLAAPRTDRFSA